MAEFASIHYNAPEFSERHISVVFFDENAHCLSQVSDVDPKIASEHAKSLGLSTKNHVVIVTSSSPSIIYLYAMMPKSGSLHDYHKLGASIYRVMKQCDFDAVQFFWPSSASDAEFASSFGAIIKGFYGSNYSFSQYKKSVETLRTYRINHITDNESKLTALFADVQAVVSGEMLTKDLMHEPPNILTPKAFAQRITSMESLGLQIEVMDEKKLLEQRMHALLSVGQGSTNPSQLVTVKWCGRSDDCSDPIALVGKGVCFDSGGINIKLQGLVDMKYDMGGAASVIGAMHAIAKLKLPVNVIAVVALTENMPGGRSYRPSDIIQSRAGKSIEVLNTDAEGRLILVDAIDYVREFQPKAIIDLATLTGAIIVGLGHEYAGLFSNDEKLSGCIQASSKATGDKLWPMPLDPAYDVFMDSPIADVSNLSSQLGKAGSITAAQFLQRFVGDLPWAHIDIAGTAWIPQHNGVHPKGPTGYGVSLLVDVVSNYQ